MITDNPQAPPTHDHAREARQLLRAHRYGALCTLSKKYGGHPFGSITPYLVDHQGDLLILISTLAEHTKNIQQDARVSLITHSQDDPRIQTQGRVTVVGLATLDTERENIGQRYLRYFPEAGIYFAMQDFQFYRIVPQAIRYIGGFGNIHWIKADRYTTKVKILLNQEVDAIHQINTEHETDLRRLTAQEQIKAELVGIDCDGFDIRVGERLLRVQSDEPILDAQQAIQQIKNCS